MNITTTPATAKQIAFLKKLAAERPMWRDVENMHDDVIERLDKKSCSAMIDAAMAIPKETIHKPKHAGDTAADEGMYRDPSTGEIYKVQLAVHGSGRPYAKRLVKIAGWTFETHGKKSHEFEYVHGLVYKLPPEWKMTLDEAKAWGALYGSCCVCGALLTDEKSIAAGIGPVCAKKF
jgi:hypothetical protein